MSITVAAAAGDVEDDIGTRVPVGMMFVSIVVVSVADVVAAAGVVNTCGREIGVVVSGVVVERFVDLLLSMLVGTVGA